MPEAFNMPKLGLTMESGRIISWLVDDGAEVEPGQPLLLIETDKVESEVESPGSGRLHRTGVDGEDYECGATIGWFLADGEAAPAAAPKPTQPSASSNGAAAVQASAPTSAPVASAVRASAAGVAARGDGGRLLVSPNARRLADERGIDLTSITGTGPGGRIVSEDLDGVAATAVSPLAVAPGLSLAGSTVPATAAARQLADLLGVDLREVTSHGPDPRLTRDDVALHVRNILAERAGGGAPATDHPLEQEPQSVIAWTGMRSAIAERMSTSLQEAAQLTLHMDVDMDAIVEDRQRRKASAGDVPGITDYVIAATADALVEHPHLNSQVTAEGIALLSDIHIGMAVALDDGLIVPVIRDTPSLSIEDLSSESTRLATAARDRKLNIDEIRGGTFSVTALGMFGVDGFTPIINPPNTGILGIGRLRTDVALSDAGTPIGVSRLTLSLTWDHRAVDGAPAAQFVGSIKRRLEGYQPSH